MPEIDSGGLGGFKLQILVATEDGSVAPRPAQHLFVITHRLADGRMENFVARGGDAGQQIEMAEALRESREELRRLAGLLVSIQEDERHRIALDLHDGLGQTLSLIKLAMEQAARLLAEGAPEEAGETLTQLTSRIGEALGEVRRVSSELRPLILDDLGLLPTLSWFFREFSAVSPGIEVESALNVTEQDVPVRLHITIYRIIQEAFHNIVKHAAASRVHVRIERTDDMLDLLIEDDGCGFDPDSMKCIDCQTRGLGLLSMKERALVSGGTYHLRSAGGQGTCIWASWRCTPPA